MHFLLLSSLKTDLIKSKMTVNKRPLPPTPTSTTSTKYTNVNDAIQSLLQDTNIEHLTERERRWYTDLTNCHKAMEQKESTISNLKTIVMEWKKKAIEYENAYKAMKQKLEDREQFLIKQHQAEIEVITKTQTEQVNEHLELILQLETENQALKNKEQCQQQQLPNPNSANDIYTSSTVQLCNEAQMANKLASESVVYNKDNSDHLIQSINDMVNAMEGTLHEFRYHHHHHDEAPASYSPPALISDSSYSSSDESIDEPPSPALPQPQQSPPNKKRSLRNNFLFRSNSRKSQDDLPPPSAKKVYEPLALQRKATRASSLLSF